VITAQEILVDNASYPTVAIDQNSHDYRPLGLGYANLGVLLMDRGLPYDSEAGRTYAAAVTSLMHGEAYAQSARIASAMGPFAGYAKNAEPMLRVIDKHRQSAHMIDSTQVPRSCSTAATSIWDEAYSLGVQNGYRNSQVTVLAPTGTIGFMMDCDTTGIEPDIALVKYKKLVGGGVMKIVNQSVPGVLKRMGYSAGQIEDVIKYIDEKEMIEGAPHLKAEHLAVFDCAFPPANGKRSIHYMGHIKMMAAVQPFLSGAISKTVNMPSDATPEDISHAYAEAWRLGLKAIAVYRDGCKRSQPLSTSKDEKVMTTTMSAPRPRPRRARPARSCRTSGTPSPTSSRSPATRATSRSACTKTASRARSSWSWPRRARRSPASWTPSRRRSRCRCSTACPWRRWSRSSRTCASSPAASPRTATSLRQEHHRLHLPVAGLEVPLQRAGAGGRGAGERPHGRRRAAHRSGDAAARGPRPGARRPARAA
jgi:ribonucleotide reductase alpha subunit